MGWADEAFRDSDDVLGAGRDSMWITGSLSRPQFDALIAHGGYRKLADHLHDARPGTKFIAAGQKNYAVHSASGPTGDIQVTFSGRSFDCADDGVAANTYRGPTGVNVPAYLAEPVCGRFYVDSSSSLTYGTGTTAPAWMYPLDGNRYAVGRDPAHLGGDVWTVDAALAMMEREPWSGMLLTLGAVDKAGHMWGGITDDGVYPPGSDEEQAHLRFAVETADAQIGRLVAKLRELGQLDDTLIVLTTDHAGQPSRRFHGVDAAGRGDFNWYYGETENGDYLAPSPALAPLIATGNVRFTYQDSAIRTWLVDTSDAAKESAAEVMAGLPDVIASYRLDGSRYRLVRADRAEMSPPGAALLAPPRPDARRHDGRPLRRGRRGPAQGRRELRGRRRPRRRAAGRAGDPDRVRGRGRRPERLVAPAAVGGHPAHRPAGDGDPAWLRAGRPGGAPAARVSACARQRSGSAGALRCARRASPAALTTATPVDTPATIVATRAGLPGRSPRPAAVAARSAPSAIACASIQRLASASRPRTSAARAPPPSPRSRAPSPRMKTCVEVRRAARRPTHVGPAAPAWTRNRTPKATRLSDSATASARDGSGRSMSGAWCQTPRYGVPPPARRRKERAGW